VFRRSVPVPPATARALLAPAALRAQAGAAPPAGIGLSSGRVTLGGAFGGLSGAANLNPAGTTDWRLGWIGSVDGTVWLERHVGIRASGSWAQDSISNAALTGRGKFNKFTYAADLVPRDPAQAGSASLYPSVGCGVGGI